MVPTLHRYLWPLLTVLAVVMVAYGAWRGEYNSVNRWAHALCTSCVGLGR